MSTRRISTGKLGRALLGSIVADNNKLQSVVANVNIVLEPNGSGLVESLSDIQLSNAKTLRLADSDSSAYVGLKSPANVTNSITYTLPGAITQNYFLTTDASGNLSWANATVNISNQTTDTATYYPVVTTSTSGNVNTVNVSTTKLTFVPSTGTISATLSRVTGTTASSSTSTGALVVSGGAGIAGQLTATTLVETSSIAFKENINPIENALEVVTQLFGVTYDRKDNNEHEAGLIAEHVYNVAPDLVSLDKDGKPYGIKYTKIGAYLIEAIKSLKNELDELKGKQ